MLVISPGGPPMSVPAVRRPVWLWAAIALFAGAPPALPQPVGDPALPFGAIRRLGRTDLTHQERATCAAFAPDGTVLATGAFDRYARLWDAATGRELKALPHAGCVRSVAWAPDGKTLFT